MTVEGETSHGLLSAGWRPREAVCDGFPSEARRRHISWLRDSEAEGADSPLPTVCSLGQGRIARLPETTHTGEGICFTRSTDAMLISHRYPQRSIG